MTTQKQGTEFFEEGPNGPTDIKLHLALLGEDNLNTFNLNDPRQLAARLARQKHFAEVTLPAREQARAARKAARKGRA